MFLFFDKRFLRVSGILLDALGVLLIAIAFVCIENKELQGRNLEDVIKKLNHERKLERRISLAGAVLIFLGFVLLIRAELLNSDFDQNVQNDSIPERKIPFFDFKRRPE
jgi:hypothetical protein